MYTSRPFDDARYLSDTCSHLHVNQCTCGDSLTINVMF